MTGRGHYQFVTTPNEHFFYYSSCGPHDDNRTKRALVNRRMCEFYWRRKKTFSPHNSKWKISPHKIHVQWCNSLNIETYSFSCCGFIIFQFEMTCTLIRSNASCLGHTLTAPANGTCIHQQTKKKKIVNKTGRNGLSFYCKI